MSAALFCFISLLLLSVVNAARPMVVCPDNSIPIQHCPRGLCSTGYFCYQGWCCRNRGYNIWNNNYNRPYGNRLYGTCPDGSRGLQRCPRGRCPTGYFCRDGWCCRNNRGWGNNGWNNGWNNNNGGWRGPNSRGRCPQMFGPMVGNNHQCYSHNECPPGRLCCKTMSGRRCLFPQ
ncbi:hypothetical protein M514_07659 [Trichuris suis]|uniref:WAP domain-containing protein n=1 Tax=Trichuris suis TaxID=68888 RepID=A0A085N8H7_9BILA|nr:hypothetical protein M513_07659 [Trichuris suis]KFD65773.1 hypothetical protein M514_07659 [Trichuris suis]